MEQIFSRRAYATGSRGAGGLRHRPGEIRVLFEQIIFAHDLTPWTGAARAHLLCRFRIQVSKSRGLNFSHSSLIHNSAKRFFQSSTTCAPSCVPRSETPWLCSNSCASSTAGCCHLPASCSTRSPVCDCAPHAPSWRCSRRALDFQFRDRYRVLLSWR
jgi:hypothetical protein